jgi:hypothetical protein
MRSVTVGSFERMLRVYFLQHWFNLSLSGGVKAEKERAW